MTRNDEIKGVGLKLKTFFSTLIILSLVISLASALTITSVKNSPSEIAPGKTGEISIELENTLSHDAEDVHVMLDFSSFDLPLAPYQSSSEQSIDKIDKDDEELFTFEVIALPEAKSGIYKIPFSVVYNDKGVQKENKGTVSIIINSQPEITIVGEGALVKGMQNKITLLIINNGLASAKLLSVQLPSTISKATIISPKYNYLGDIESDDFDNIELDILTSSDAGNTITFPATLQYKDATNKEINIIKQITIPVYSREEAQKIGLVDSPNYFFYVIIASVVLLIALYRLLRKRKK